MKRLEGDFKSMGMEIKYDKSNKEILLKNDFDKFFKSTFILFNKKMEISEICISYKDFLRWVYELMIYKVTIIDDLKS